VAESLKVDISALESLAVQKKISAQLSPLIEACEKAKNNSASFSKALRSEGLTVSRNRYLNDIVNAFNSARKELPDPGMAFLAVRDLALSLNNDSNDPESAFVLIKDLIDLGEKESPKIIMDRLREERSVLHKNWKMKELDRQSGNLGGMLRVVDELLVYANSSDRRDLVQLKAKIQGKQNAKLVKYFIYGAIGLFMVIAMAGG
jgi:methionine synthase II (cobalamin-independent)